MAFPVAGLAAQRAKDMSQGAFMEAFQEGYGKGLFKYDESHHFTLLPRFLRHNPPESPNVVKSWEKYIDELPECELLIETIQIIRSFLKTMPKAFQEAFVMPSRKAMPNQEQEQEHDIRNPLPPLTFSEEEKKGKQPKDPRPEIPEWLDKNTWDNYRKHRRKLKRPMTEEAERLAIRSLDRARQQGHNPKLLIELSIEKGWLGIFPDSVQQGKTESVSKCQSCGEPAAGNMISGMHQRCYNLKTFGDPDGPGQNTLTKAG